MQKSNIEKLKLEIVILRLSDEDSRRISTGTTCVACTLRSFGTQAALRINCALKCSDDLGNDGPEQADELGFDALGGFQHFVVIKRLVENTGSSVGNARDAQGANAGVARGDNFGNGGHPDQIGADSAEITDFRRRFVTGAGECGVDAFTEIDPEASSGGERQFAEFFVVGVGHVRETRAEFIGVWSGERVGALQIDVVADDDEASLRELFFDTAGGVSEDYHFHAEAREDPDRESDLVRRVAFVEMHSPLHPGDFDAIHFADDQLSGVAYGRGTREVRNLCVRDSRSSGEFVGKGAQAGTEDQRNLWAQFRFFLDEAGGGFGPSERHVRRGNTCPGTAHVRIPTMQADIRLAMVPASIA